MPMEGAACTVQRLKIQVQITQIAMISNSNFCEFIRKLIRKSYSETLNGLTKLVVKYILNRGTSLSISYRSHQIHSQLILWF